MQDIDVFIAYHYGHKITPLFHKDNFVHMLYNHLNFYISSQDLHNYFREYPPKTKHIVHRLKEMGFSPNTICEWLGLTPGTVSYHLSRPLKNNYRCYPLRAYINKFNTSISTIEKNTTKK
jgi:hypothetical protein